MPWFANPRFAFCRGVANHAWRFPPELNAHGRELVLVLRCMNCEAARHDKVTPHTGDVVARHYTYPEGYLLELNGKPRPPKDTLRRDGLQLLLKGVRPSLKVVRRRGRRAA
jgi:hypothetical protein